jgi:N-carbamoyl-L-amino-acid hydrolase
MNATVEGAMNQALHRLNTASLADAIDLLDGLYEHSRWIAEAAVAKRPFASLAALKRALSTIVADAPRDAQLALIRAHPALAGKAALAGDVTAASTDEQQRAGLLHCDADELATLRRLNDDYLARFGWPCILAVRGPRGLGLSRRQIIATFERRATAHPDLEFAECLRQIDRIAELRIAERFAAQPTRGETAWDRAEALAAFSDPEFAERGELTVTYLTEAHRASARMIERWMSDAGFDEVASDAVGNVVGVYHAADPAVDHSADEAVDEAAERGVDRASDGVEAGRPVKRLMTGSHYDTVRNAGRHDGRLGILVPIACVESLHRAGRRLPFAIEVIGFAEEEGQRYKATFLGSRAVVGRFDFDWLDQTDVDDISMRDAMLHVGLPATREAIAAIARDPSDYLGFVEVHIEQGPVLNARGLPLGIVTSINGSLRYRCEVKGVASHAGTTPMDARRDAVNAVAELALFLEQRAASVPDLVGTIGILTVPDGSTNVVPGRCRFTLDLRATSDEVRDACATDVIDRLKTICERRGLSFEVEETMRAAACPSSPLWQQRWEEAVASLGLPIHRMPSGAGHDAMMLHQVMPQAMLFVRGENGGISHNPLESTTADDIELAIEAFDALLDRLR